jgi:hypothetical protein
MPGHRVRLISQLWTINSPRVSLPFTVQTNCGVWGLLIVIWMLKKSLIETEYILPHSKQPAIMFPSLRTIPIQNSQHVSWYTNRRCVRNSELSSWRVMRVRVVEAQWHLSLGTGSTADRSLSSWPALMPVQTRHLRPKQSPQIIRQHKVFCHGDTRRGTEVWNLMSYQILTGHELEELSK